MSEPRLIGELIAEILEELKPEDVQESNDLLTKRGKENERGTKESN